MTAPNITVEVHSSIATLKDEWTSMDNEAISLIADGKEPIEYSFYQTYAWNEFVEHFYRSKGWLWHRCRHIDYICLREDGKLRIILPLLVTVFPSRKIEMTSWKTAGINNAVSLLNSASDNSGRTTRLFDALTAYIATNYKGFKVKFNDMPAGIPFVRSVAALNGLTERERPSFHVPVGQFKDFETYYASLSKNFHTGYRRCCNHFNHGDLQRGFRIFDSENPPSQEYWQKLWSIYFLRKIDWKKKSRSGWRKLYASFETSREIRSGMKTASFTALRNSRLFVMEINGSPAAFCFAYIWGPTGVMPKFAIDTAHSVHSPGLLMFMDVIKWCFDNGIRDFDLCRGNERYKQRVGGIMAPLAGIKGRL